MGMAHSPRIDLRPGIIHPVALRVTRGEVESGDVAAVVHRLFERFRSPEVIWKTRGQMVLVVDGYADDPRELVDVPQVRAFLIELDRQWPYWAFFFNQVDHSIMLLAACVAGIRFAGNGSVEFDPGKLRAFLVRGFSAMNAIFSDHGFPEADIEVISDGVIEVIEQAWQM